MSVKAVLMLCAQALFIQSVLSQCGCGGSYGWGAPALTAPAAAVAGSGLGCGAGPGYGAGLGLGGLAIQVIPTSGGALPISSVSAIAPGGLSVASENAYEGALAVAGELPFVGAVALEGVLPSAGAGAVSYSCGNGVAIESITPAAVAIAPAAAGYGPGIAAGTTFGTAIAPGLGYAGIAGRGCGCGLY